MYKNVQVRAAINAGKVEISKRLRINQDEVIKELARIGFARLTDVCSWVDGKVVITDSEKLTDDQATSLGTVKSTTIKVGEDTTKTTLEIKQHDKVKALMGILDRVKPTEPPQKIEHTVKMANMPPEPKTMAEWEALCHLERKPDRSIV